MIPPSAKTGRKGSPQLWLFIFSEPTKLAGHLNTRMDRERSATLTTKPFRVFATCDIGQQALDVLRQRGYEVEVYDRPEAPPKQLILDKLRTGVDGLITTLRDPIDEEVFRAGQGHLKVVAQYAVGVDNIDRAAANRYRVPFTHTPDVLTEATAEFAFFIMGALARKLWTSEQLLREHQWGYWHPYLPFLGDEVTGKTIAVVGTGRIGLAMIKKCSGFDMNVLCYDPQFQNQEFASHMQEVMELRYRHGLSSERTTIRYVELEEALRHADFVSVHVPLLRDYESNKPTYHLINERTLRQMKPTAYLVNTSRGPVVDELALARALKENWIAGAALDVFEREPLPADSPLRDHTIQDRCRLFPHFASAGTITRLSPHPDKGMAGRTVHALINVLEGKAHLDQLPWVVNKEAFREKAA